MKFKTLTATAALVLALSATPAAQAYDFVYGGIYYNKSGKNAVVTYASLDESTYEGDIVIPAQVMDRNFVPYTVKSVGDWAFINAQRVNSVTLPEGLTAIGSQSFSHCYAMQSVTLPSTLQRVGDFAFEYCEDMVSVTLPDALTSIGEGVFIYCNGLQEINVGSGNKKFKSVDGVLFNIDVTSLKVFPPGYTSPSYTLPETVTEICELAFYDCRKLKHLTLPESLSTVNGDAFVYSSDFLTITCYATVPPTCTGYTDGMGLFSNNVLNNATLIVPETAVDAYRADRRWGEFKNIISIEESGIENVTVDSEGNAEEVFYNINGVRASDTSAPGIYISSKGKRIIR